MRIFCFLALFVLAVPSQPTSRHETQTIFVECPPKFDKLKVIEALHQPKVAKELPAMGIARVEAFERKYILVAVTPLVKEGKKLLEDKAAMVAVVLKQDYKLFLVAINGCGFVNR